MDLWIKPERPRFKSAKEARNAIYVRGDGLATLYWTKDQVTVISAHGYGTFSREEWGDDEGQRGRACGSLGDDGGAA